MTSEQGPTVRAFINEFDATCAMLRDQILLCDDEKSVADAIETVIIAGSAAMAGKAGLRNFNFALICHSVVTYTPCSKSELSAWKLLSKKVLAAYAGLHEECSAKGNYHRLKLLLSSAHVSGQTVIPHVGLLLSELESLRSKRVLAKRP